MPLTGEFFVSDANPSAQIGAGNFAAPGVHQLTAKFSGDASNLSSTSPAITQAITGTMYIIIEGATGDDTHLMTATVGVQ
jgi:hypothetical protein